MQTNNARSVTGSSRNILRLWGQVVGECFDANIAYRNHFSADGMWYVLSPVGFHFECTVGREQRLCLALHKRILLQCLEMLAVGRYRKTPQRPFLIVDDLDTHQSPDMQRLTLLHEPTFKRKLTATSFLDEVARKTGNLKTVPGKKKPACIDELRKMNLCWRGAYHLEGNRRASPVGRFQNCRRLLRAGCCRYGCCRKSRRC